jgi:hypothetical protein
VTEGFWDDARRPGTVKLVDFGIAVPAANPDKLTAVGHVIGTLAFLSPELIDPATWGRVEGPVRDVFAFGVLAHELCFGRHPTGLGPRATMIDFARAYKAAEAQRIPWPPPAIKDAADAFIARCLALRPADRPPDGAEIEALMRAGGAAGRASWTGMSGPTTPHRQVTEPSPAPPVTPPPVERTAPMGTERTVPAAPIPAAMVASPAAATKRGSGMASAVVAGMLAGAAVSAWFLLRPSPADDASSGEPPPSPVTTPPSPSVAPAPAPAPVAENLGACCRSNKPCLSKRSRFACPVCVGDPPPLPERGWWMRIGGVEPHTSFNTVCARLEGSDQVERCVPFARLPDNTRAPGHLRVTTDDVYAGRVVFTLKRGDVPVASGHGKGAKSYRASALCMGLPLHIDDPDGGDVAISIYLDPDDP